MKYLYKDNDNLIKLLGVKNNATNVYVDSSSNVTVALTELDGTSEIGAQAMTYVAASNGDYQVTWDTTTLSSVAVGNYYLVYVVAEGGLDLEIQQLVGVRDRIIT
jgi:hypothetical protein